ncbi:hypothetical protein ACIRBY_22505 [Streptomyces sp. NPDC096136]|uniref:hypothetical protein n=1 Tax=Streptomyces sp. NPDC096136 TaxID=3366076 RepID=UPI0037FF6044
MHRTTLRLAVPLALAAALAATACLPASAAGSPPTAPPAAAAGTAGVVPAVGGISGWGRMAYGDPRDDVRISVDAHGLFTRPAAGAPSGPSTAVRSWGGFRIQHYSPPKDGEPAHFNWGDFRVDCLRVDGTEVSVTGRLVDAGPVWQDYLHRKPLPARMALGFHVPGPGGGDAARVGILAPAGDQDMPPCSTPKPDAGLTAGGYRLSAPGAVPPGA